MKCKEAWLDFAEVIDSLRVIPRLILFGYAYWMVNVTDRILVWYFKLPAIERTTQVTAVITIVLPGIFGLAVWVYKIYSQGGLDWTKRDKKAPADPTAGSVTATATLTAPAT